MNSVWDQSVAGHKHVVRQYIIDAMLELVSEKGVSNVSMGELSKSAKVSRQTLYNYFPDLESALGAWMEQEADMLYQEIREKTESLENLLEQLFVYIVTSLQSCEKRQYPTGVEAAMSMQAAVGAKLRDQISDPSLLWKTTFATSLSRAFSKASSVRTWTSKRKPSSSSA